MATAEVDELEVVRRVLGLGEHDRVEYDDDGWDSRVYVVSRGQAVFKFPRSVETRHQYRREVAVLEALEGAHTSIRVPRVMWRHPDLAWFGYQGIVGDQLSYRLNILDTHAKHSMGRSLGTFLRTLHGCRVGDVPTVSLDDEIARYHDKYRLAMPALDTLSVDELALARSFFFDVLPNALHRLGGELRLTHGDLGPWNIILTDSLEVGVIDFGDASYQDPSIDFSGFGDTTMLKAALEAYGADDWLREKVWLRIRAFPILDLPFYLGKHDDAGVRLCLDLVRRVTVRGEIAADRPLHGAFALRAERGYLRGSA